MAIRFRPLRIIEHKPGCPQRTLHSVEFMSTGHGPDTADAMTAVEVLREALAAAGIVLPSLATDTASPALELVNLGRVRADVALRLADAIRQGRA